ncbi:carbonic anhydrase [Saliphagus sp. GCM10025317]
MTSDSDSDSDSTDARDDHATVLFNLLEGNERHVDSLADGYFDAVRDEQHPDVVTMCCSDSRVSQEGMWSIDRPGAIFTPSTIGNQIWDVEDGERFVDGSVLYPIHYTDTEAVAVVGHTGCGAVTAAYEVASGDEEPPGPRGVTKWVEALVPVVESGLESELVDTDIGSDDDVDADADTGIIDQLVEYNVHRQVSYLRMAESIPSSVSCYGFVYDFHETYGSEPGRAYLVNLDGETDPRAIAMDLPDTYADSVSSLLY